MRVAGVICEYNPFHNGHLYHISETKRLLGEDTLVVCAMSGNFVQRGEPAIFAKFARAEAAVKCGADIVVEIPTHVSLSSAEGFAKGAVQLLDSMGVCTHLSFGSENGDIAELSCMADALLLPQTDELIKSELKKGVSYAVARQNALRSIVGDKAELLEQPNNILGIEYLKALKVIRSDMAAITVSRHGGEHDGKDGYSASAVRRSLKAGERSFLNVPDAAAMVFKREISEGRGPVYIEDMEQAILYRLRTMTAEEYDKLPYASEGLGKRLLKSVRSSTSLTEILEKTKTKRYAMSRLRRMVMCAYLGLSAEDMSTEPNYIRVLGVSVNGCTLLRRMRKSARLPVIVKSADCKELITDSKACDLYTIAYSEESQRNCGTDYTFSPYIEKQQME